jgi:hypothetical protein
VTGNIIGGSGNSTFGINNTGTGSVNVTGNVNGGSSVLAHGINNNSIGIVLVTGNSTGGTGSGNQPHGINNVTIGTITLTGSVTGGISTGVPSNGIMNASTGTLTVTGGEITATVAAAAIVSRTGTNRISGSLISAINGNLPVDAVRFITLTTPAAAKTRYALNGTGTYVDMFTADNSLGQANPSDVRTGVSYASGNLTGTLTVPVRGTISYGVTYGPAMPFTATRSGTTATATLAYSYPYQVGDTFTVTGASNPEWNGDYTVASVVSGTSVTFSVPATLPASTSSGAVLQTKGTAVLDGASVASAVWSAATRSITGGTVDTLTNPPTVPTVVQIRQEMDSNSTKLANLDATVSSRLAPNGTLATVTTLTNAPTVPSATDIATQVRTELSTELGRLDATVSSRLASASYTAPANSDISAIKAKTDNLPASPAATGDIPTAAQNATAVWSKPANELTVADSIGERAKQQSTVAITGAQLAAALS